MKIEYDPRKNAANIAKHGLDFEDVVMLEWEEALVWPDVCEEYGEIRYCALAMNRRVYCVAYTLRDDDVFRIISFRKANKRENREYHDRYRKP